MSRIWKVDYEEKVDNFAKYSNIKSILISGKPNSNAFISYVIPVYKRADLLEKTLDSVLNQQDVDFEWNIVIVDNEAGEINDTQRLIEKINSDKIVYYRNEKNIGVDGNYNRCIELAKSKWVAMIHGDDLIMDDHLKCNAEYISYIEQMNNGRELAYICQPYVDFSDEESISLNRNSSGKYRCMLSEVYNDGYPQRQPRLFGIMSGYYATLPSFGTIMNRGVMIKTGGFSETLGICEDVITPFRIAKDYDVYMAPIYMGFHRFDRNESMKEETILKIYAAMVEFREYMYTTVWWGRIWGFVARDRLNEGLRNYCVGQSRFCGNVIPIDKFDKIYAVKSSKIRKAIFEYIWNRFVAKHNLRNNKSYIESYYNTCKGQIESSLYNNKKLLVYGAGMAAKELIPLLIKDYGKDKIAGCAVTEMGSVKKIAGIKVYELNEYITRAADLTVITATVEWEYQNQMNRLLKDKKFDTVINLLF